MLIHWVKTKRNAEALLEASEEVGLELNTEKMQKNSQFTGS